LALVYWTQGKYSEAEGLYKRALAILEKALGANHPDALCQPCATPSSNSSLNYRRDDARIAENGFATSSSVNKSAKVVLVGIPTTS